jgi:apolipoprotein N-acyltransferase
MPPAAWLVAFGLEAAMFALASLLFRALVCRRAVWSALAGFPAVWVSFEYVRNLAWPHGTAGSLAYSQLGFLPFLQMASLAGPWGMSFVLLLFPAGLAVALHLRRAARAKSRQALAVTLGTIAAALIFGAVRLAAPQPGPDIGVGLVASDRDPARAGSDTERLLQRMRARRGS